MTPKVNVKERTLEITLNGKGIYFEKPKAQNSLKENLSDLQNRLESIKKAMPNGDWSITVCDMWFDEEGKVHVQLIDVESGELQIDSVD